MKVYGFDDTGPYRGDLVMANVDPHELDFGMESLACHLGWEFAALSFGEAKKKLIQEMTSIDADAELIKSVRSLKASHIS